MRQSRVSATRQANQLHVTSAPITDRGPRRHFQPPPPPHGAAFTAALLAHDHTEVPQRFLDSRRERLYAAAYGHGCNAAGPTTMRVRQTSTITPIIEVQQPPHVHVATSYVAGTGTCLLHIPNPRTRLPWSHSSAWLAGCHLRQDMRPRPRVWCPDTRLQPCENAG